MAAAARNTDAPSDETSTAAPASNASPEQDFFWKAQDLQAVLSTVPDLMNSIHDELDQDCMELSKRGESLLHVADYVIRSLLRDITIAIEDTIGQPGA